MAMLVSTACLGQDLQQQLLDDKYIEGIAIAIPPFTSHVDNDSYKWLEKGLADMLATDIAMVKRIRVVPRLPLEKILKEQSLSLSDIIDKDKSASIGKLIGATTIVTGNFTLAGNFMRIDAQCFDTTKGVSTGAASVQGNPNEVFALEKLLAIKLLNALNVKLSPTEMVLLMQISSQSLNAVKNAMYGREALFQGDKDAAKQYFQKALKADPFYRQAKRELDKASVIVSGADLLKAAKDDLAKKAAQRKALEQLYDKFIHELYDIKLGKPTTKTDSNNPNAINLHIPITIKMQIDKVIEFVEELDKIAYGNSGVRFEVTHLRSVYKTVRLSEENAKWLTPDIVASITRIELSDK